MFTSGETFFTIFDIFFIIILSLVIMQIILCNALQNQVKFKLERGYYSPEEVGEIPISSLQFIGFKEYKYAPNETKIRYDPSLSNLGFTGELILDCYRGSCIRVEKGTKSKCKMIKHYDYDDEYNYEYDEECEEEEYIYNKIIIDYLCSNECFESKGEKCNKCPSGSIHKEGTCSRRTNDIYSPDKYCTADNIIYFGKD